MLPSLFILIALSWVYIAFGDVSLVAGLFYGIKPAVTAIVVQAAHRIGSRALKNNALWAIAGASFVAIFALQAPFPLIVLVAGIIGYLGRGEGLVVHTSDCAVAARLQHRDSERFIAVDWADEPTRLFETGVVVTVINGKGVLARIAQELANSEADITHVDMDDEAALDTTDLRFVVAVRDLAHLEAALRNLRRTQAVIRANRITPQAT